MKKIVIIPCFAESHFTELQIDNLVNTIAPDIIIYNEGLFPTGPEGKGGVDNEFKREFCFEDTNLAWDTLELQTKMLILKIISLLSSYHSYLVVVKLKTYNLFFRVPKYDA